MSSVPSTSVCRHLPNIWLKKTPPWDKTCWLLITCAPHFFWQNDCTVIWWQASPRRINCCFVGRGKIKKLFCGLSEPQTILTLGHKGLVTRDQSIRSNWSRVSRDQEAMAGRINNVSVLFHGHLNHCFSLYLFTYLFWLFFLFLSYMKLKS